jgi:hypothetical protein
MPRLGFKSKVRLLRSSLRSCGFWLICFCCISAGCSLSAQKVHPEFDTRIKTVKRAVLIPPDVSMLELLPNGLIRQRADWNSESYRNLQKAIRHQLRVRQCSLQLLTPDSDMGQELAEIQTLYRLVQKSMWQQTFKSPNGSQSARSFDYSLGSIDTLMASLDADALIFVSGYDRVSAAGRKALIKLAITDNSGTILYYAVKGSIQGNDLRDPASADYIMGELFSGFSRKRL